MEISNIRNYSDNGEFCIFIDKYTGKYCYQDSFGYKSFKSISGLERMLRKSGCIAEGDSLVIA